jgi:hypothetical protein
MFYDDEVSHIDEVDLTGTTLKTETWHAPVIEAIVANPEKGLWPIVGTVVVSFFVLRWLMKS